MGNWTRPYKYAWTGAAVALAIGGVMLVNHLFRDHEIIISSPSPPSVFVDGRIPLDRGDQACLTPLRFTPAAGQIRIVVETQARPVPPLRVTARAAGAIKTTTVTSYPAGRVTEVLVPFTVKKAAPGSVCVRNVGHRRVSLASTDEARYASLTKTSLNGKPSTMQASLQLVAPHTESIAERIPVAVRQDAQLTGVLPRVLVWLLLLAVLIAIVALPLYVMTDALRRDDDEDSG
jgi:hypothetical protein